MGILSISELDTMKRLGDDLVDSMYIVDREFKLVYVNPAFRQMFRYRDRPGMRCSDHLKMGICQDACLLVECIRDKKVARWRETTSSAARAGDISLSAGAYPLMADNGEVAGAVAFLRDVSVEVNLHGKYKVLLDNERHAKEILEQTVEERTRDLRAANKEIGDILANIQQSIFTVDSGLKIGAQYSRHVEVVFGPVPVAGVGFADLLLPRSSDGEARRKLVDWGRLAFAQPHLPWELVGDLVPHEIEYPRADSELPRQFIVDYVPIREGDQIARLMVITEDVTETRALQAEIERKRKENEDNLDQIAEIIQLDPQIFDRFLDEARGLLAGMRAETRALAEVPTGLRRDRIDKIFRQIHTLKGNARSFRLNVIAMRAHWIEDLFAGVRDGSRSLDDDTVKQIDGRSAELEELVDRAARLRDRVLRRPERQDLGKTRTGTREPVLQIGVSRLVALRRACAGLRVRAEASSDLTPRDIAEILTQAEALTHVPFSKLVGRLRKVVQDLAAHLGKRVGELVVEGEGLELDAEVLNALGDPLIHLLRNALDHGIEPGDERIAHGKPEVATVALRLARDDPRFLCIDIEDDGRGVDSERVRRKAVEAGILDEQGARELDDEQAVNLIFAAGFSTADAVTEVSGRGVGMDAVRAAVVALGGEVRVHSQRGRGCRVRLTVPAEIVFGGIPAQRGDSPA